MPTDSDRYTVVSTTLTSVTDLGVWQLQLNTALGAKHPLCVRACEPFPTGNAEDLPANPTLDETTTDDQQRYAAKACHIILSSISANIQQALFVNGSSTPITNPRYMLQRIYEYLRPRDDATLLQEEAKFERITKGPTEDITAYASRLESQASTVVALGGSVHERNKIARFKWGLMHDSAWAPWIASQDSIVSTPVSFRALVSAARAFEHQLQLRAELHSAAAREVNVFLATTDNDGTCQRCLRPGHAAAMCWTPLTRDEIIALHDKTNTDGPSRQPPRNRKPPTPCPYCDGNHWRRECPQRPRKESQPDQVFYALGESPKLTM